MVTNESTPSVSLLQVAQHAEDLNRATAFPAGMVETMAFFRDSEDNLVGLASRRPGAPLSSSTRRVTRPADIVRG